MSIMISAMLDLTEDQKRQVKECWGELMKRMDGLEAGMYMFMRLVHSKLANQLLHYCIGVRSYPSKLQ